MALTNAQYDEIMRTYEQMQLHNEYQLRKRYEEAFSKIPELKELSESVSGLSLSKAKRLLDGDSNALSLLKEDIAALSLRKKQLLRTHDYPDDYLELQYNCSDCQDTGYIGTQKCHCFKKEIIDLLYTQSNLQTILEKENFSTLSFSYYSVNHIDPLTGRSSKDSIETAIKSCHEFINTFSTEFRNILLYGDTGVGKTFLSHCIAKELIDASYSVIYFTATQLFDVFAKNTFGKKEEMQRDVFDHIYDCDLLIIDDLGTELSNSFTTSQLFVCINERILRQKSTLISTNLALEDVKSIYSERSFSRLSSNYTMLRLTGDDIRIQKKLLILGGTKDVTP